MMERMNSADLTKFALCIHHNVHIYSHMLAFVQNCWQVIIIMCLEECMNRSVYTLIGVGRAFNTHRK